MAYPSFTELARAEQYLRRDDKALRLRFAMAQPSTVLIERKTFRGRYGALMVGGLPYLPDSGYRREHGHVHVAAIRCNSFDVVSLREALAAADTWKRSRAFSLADDLERREQMDAERRKQSRQDLLRYKTSELFDRYVWRYKQRVTVPERIS